MKADRDVYALLRLICMKSLGAGSIWAAFPVLRLGLTLRAEQQLLEGSLMLLKTIVLKYWYNCCNHR